ncbi:MAG: hypothetical protein KIT09_34215 [Bryobacteraceae bacterium]|nr:hypothetical protein [Bryobacteraceae bacterium]
MTRRAEAMLDNTKTAAPTTISQDGSKWYALTVKSRHEKTVAKALSYKRIAEFVPVYQDRRRWSDRWKSVETPLFPGYVFCFFSLERRAAVLSTPGVTSIVSFGGRAGAIPDTEIAALRAIAGSGLPARPWPHWLQGERVMIVGGPLRGVVGRVSCAGQSRHIVLSVDLLQRSVAVPVDHSLIVAIERTAGPAGCVRSAVNQPEAFQ